MDLEQREAFWRDIEESMREGDHWRKPAQVGGNDNVGEHSVPNLPGKQGCYC